ncbi:MAG: dethiobiotin synthase [Piscirickettsiaceae bacterium]|nr:MAG: dethiobiotin synthase [Piscirickettsiaceae bacterium]
MTKGFFITGTDTGVGKTYVSTQLIKACRERQLRVSGYKPVASGAKWASGTLVNDDALALIQQASVPLPYEVVNPYCFEPAIAPHLAAEQAGVEISIDNIQSNYQQHTLNTDVVIVEGAGGWKVPLGDDLGFDVIPSALDIPVVLVVGLKLGCINHALLSEEAIMNSGCQLIGWVANDHTDDFQALGENMDSLKKRMKTPCIGFFEYQLKCEESKGNKQINVTTTLDYLINFS